MRRLHTVWWAVAGATGLLAGLVAPSAAAPATTPATPPTAVKGTTRAVTLITGDTVSVTTGADGKNAVSVDRGTGRGGVNFLTNEANGEVSVIPDDAVPLIQAGRIDPALFNISQLVEQGYGDTKTASLPLIATYRKGSETPDAARKTLSLPSIDGAALSATKSTAETFWADIAPGADAAPDSKAARTLGDGLDKVWLDAEVKVDLDVSVPQIGAPEVWKSGFDGTGVKVAVLDTGADLGHPDLAGKIAEEKSFIPDVNSVQDGHGHGTHVASTIVGSGAASGGKYKGVAPGAELMVGKVLNDAGQGQSSWILAGMEWAADSGADVVSMSLGGTATAASDPLSEAVDRLTADTGTLFVIAAGNSGPSAGTVGTPGIAPSALTVGAVSKTDELASFSSRGPAPVSYAVKPEITAPGVNITAARAAGTTMGTPVDANYTTASGTSMATPHVAGAAALVVQAHPGWTPEQVKESLASTAKTLPGSTAFEQGDGRVDAVKAVGQGVFATSTLSFGKFEQLEDTDPATKEITYTNTTDTSVELALDTTLSDPSLSVGATSVTVPAQGTATVPVTVDPAKAAIGSYAGHVTATADGVRIATAFGYQMQPRTYDLKINVLDRAGVAPSYALYSLQGLSDPSANETGNMGGTWTWHVPAGTYSMATWIPQLDGAGTPVATSVVGNPEIKVAGDTEVTLDARKAVEIKPRTKEDSEFQGFSTSWRRTGSAGTWGLSYAQGWWTDHIYVAPTEPVTEGSFEFDAKFRMYAKELTTEVVAPERDALALEYSQTYTGYPTKVSGAHTVTAVDAGGGTEADFAGLDVKGKAAVVALGATERADAALANGTAAGASYVIAYRKTPGYWLTAVDKATSVPLMIATGEDGARLTALLGEGRKVTLKLNGIPASPYVYNLTIPQPGAIAKNQTYTFDRSNTARRTSGLYADTAGRIGYDYYYSYRPGQLVDYDNGRYLPLGRERTEYFNVDPDTRIWQAMRPAAESFSKQWNTLRVYGKPGAQPADEWLRQAVRPATNTTYGVSARTGDTITLQIPELNDASADHFGAIDGRADLGQGTLYSGDQKVGASALGGYGVFTVPAAQADYRFALDTHRTAAWTPYSTSTHTEWTFPSAHTDAKTALGVLSVDYDLGGVDLLNRVAARHEVPLGLTLRDQEGSVRATSLKAWVSYDDGTTWKEVYVHGGKARLKPAKGAQHMSLRVKATDGDGNTIDQTILRAYGIK